MYNWQKSTPEFLARRWKTFLNTKCQNVDRSKMPWLGFLAKGRVDGGRPPGHMGFTLVWSAR